MCNLLVKLADAVQSVERGNFITFRESWIVEDGFYEIIKLSAKSHNGLSDMHQFAGTFADDVDTEQGVGHAMEDQLKTAGGVAANLPACDLAVVCDANP